MKEHGFHVDGSDGQQIITKVRPLRCR